MSIASRLNETAKRRKKYAARLLKERNRARATEGEALSILRTLVKWSPHFPAYEPELAFALTKARALLAKNPVK